MAKKISSCRICGGKHLTDLLDLGNMMHAGVFNETGVVPHDPLALVLCSADAGCGLIQLKHEFDPDIMYGDHYGYRSGLNKMMVEHLQELANSTIKFADLSAKMHLNILDIGSNDGTLLGHFKDTLGESTNLYGIDPSSKKFREYYQEGIYTSDEFFSANEYFKLSDGKKADIVSSIAMFYDLPNPQKFVDDISNILSDEGTWVVEQSYLPLMLGSNSFDTICHEHTEYYCLQQFVWMCARSDLQVVRMELNSSNGGSFRLYIKKLNANVKQEEAITQFLYTEKLISSDWSLQIREFSKRISLQREKLFNFFEMAKREKKNICGLGASTKGNVLLQYFGLNTDHISAIAEINMDKIGLRTPQSRIPILDQAKALNEFDYFLVLPWHFKENFLSNPKFKGKTLIFPLPEFEMVSL